MITSCMIFMKFMQGFWFLYLPVYMFYDFRQGNSDTSESMNSKRRYRENIILQLTTKQVFIS